LSLLISNAASSPLLLWPTTMTTLFPYTTLFRSLQRHGRHPWLFVYEYLYLLEMLQSVFRHLKYELILAAQSVNNLQQTSSSLLQDRKSTRLNSSHVSISYAVFCLKKKKTMTYSL